MSGRMGWVNNHVVARSEVAAIPVDTVLWRAIYLSFFRMAADNPNLDPRGKLSWEVFALAYLQPCDHMVVHPAQTAGHV